jgi:hypothetical protein
MPAKQIMQQPVALKDVNSVTYILYTTGGLDYNYAYTPVDAAGKPVGEKRTLSGSKSGAAATTVKDWITQQVLPEINTFEGT